MSDVRTRAALFVDTLYLECIWGIRFDFPFIESGCDMRSLKEAVNDLYGANVVYGHCFSVIPEPEAQEWDSTTVARPPAGAGFHVTTSSSLNQSANEALADAAVLRLSSFAIQELKAELLVFVGHRPDVAYQALRTHPENSNVSAVVLWDFEESDLTWKANNWTVFAWNFSVGDDLERAERTGTIRLDDMGALLHRLKELSSL